MGGGNCELPLQTQSCFGVSESEAGLHTPQACCAVLPSSTESLLQQQDGVQESWQWSYDVSVTQQQAGRHGSTAGRHRAEPDPPCTC
jgi:hypothetical protein